MAYNTKEIWASATNYGAHRALHSIRYIAVHFTSNDGDTAENNGKYFRGENRKASAHYFVDDTTVVHSVPDDRVAWAAIWNCQKCKHAERGAVRHDKKWNRKSNRSDDQ